MRTEVVRIQNSYVNPSILRVRTPKRGETCSPSRFGPLKGKSMRLVIEKSETGRLGIKCPLAVSCNAKRGINVRDVTDREKHLARDRLVPVCAISRCYCTCRCHSRCCRLLLGRLWRLQACVLSNAFPGLQFAIKALALAL